METNFNEENKRTFVNDPQYFGSYLNLARLNIYTINNHLANKFKLPQLRQEGQIPTSFLTDNKAKEFKSRQSHVYALLKRFMPVVKAFDFEELPIEEQTGKDNYGKNFDALTATLKTVFPELNDFRNDYTHYYSIENATTRKTQISVELSSFLKDNYIRAIAYTKKRFKDVFIEDDFNIAAKAILVNNDNTITQDGIVFLIAMFLDRENAFQFIGKIKGLKGTQENNFLAKRQVLMAYSLTLPNEKFVSENLAQAFSLELINELNKCPKVLYHVIADEEKKKFNPDIKNIQNVLDNSVPDNIDNFEAYIESISKKVRNENRFAYFALKYIDEKSLFTKARFQIDLGKVVLDEYSKPLDGNDEQRKVIENAKAFGRLQDFTNEETVLNKINKNTEKTIFEQFAPHYNLDNNKIGISIFKEETAIFIAKKTDNKVKAYLKQPLPDAFLSTHELPKIILLEYLQKGKAEELINEFIELNNSKILNWDFIEEIKNKVGQLDEFKKRSQGRKNIHAYHYKKNEEEFIDQRKIDDLKNRKEKLNQLLAVYKLNDRQIPTRILEYWLNIADVEEKTSIADKIKLMKRDCMDRLKKLEKFTKEGKGSIPKIGEMATFLAKDIVDMIIDGDRKKKITSFYYDKMQECLALYADPEKKALFMHICEKELGLYEKGGHPFLNKINFKGIRYTREIYKTYLEEKGKKMVSKLNSRTNQTAEYDESWLRKTFYTLEMNEKAGKKLTVVTIPNNESEIPFSILQLKNESNPIKDWFKNITKGKSSTDRKKPVDLPTNIFNETLVALLATELSNKNIALNENNNYNELFKLWWKHNRQDDVQPFYNAKREYVFGEEKLNFIINSKPKFIDYYQTFADKVFKQKQIVRAAEKKLNRRLPDINKADVLRSIRNKISETEKEIRIVQEEDRLMLLMFEGLVNESLSPKLKAIDIMLNETILVKEKVTGYLSFNELGERLEEKDRISIVKNITENRKRKEFSVLKKYSFDRRLPELFEYFTAEDIPLDKLKLEIEWYNKVRDIVFDLIFKLEAKIIAKDKEAVIHYIQEQKGHIQHKPYLHWLLANSLITEEDFTFLNMVRNSFAHNQYPQKQTMEIYITALEQNKFASQILETYKQKIEIILSLL